MKSNQAKTRIARLRKLIAQHNYQYYVLNDPTITNASYDQMSAELRGLKAMYPKLEPIVGYSISFPGYSYFFIK